MFLNSGQVHINYKGEFMDKNIERILKLLPLPVYQFYIANKDRNITEIRIRQGFDIKVTVDGVLYTILDTYCDKSFIENLYFAFCDNTVSAYEDQTGKGFITLDGGHRVGLSGKYITDEYGKTTLTDIISMNIRLAKFHKIKIDSDILAFKKGLLIAGKPHSGKTTFLKNLCYLLQDKNIVVCDERNELYSKEICCDFIINLPKNLAIMQALRTMNPDYIICDEIGDEKEAESVLSGVNSGVKFICSVHSNSIEDLADKPNIFVLFNANVFDKIILLDCDKNNFYIKETADV